MVKCCKLSAGPRGAPGLQTEHRYSAGTLDGGLRQRLLLRFLTSEGLFFVCSTSFIDSTQMELCSVLSDNLLKLTPTFFLLFLFYVTLKSSFFLPFPPHIFLSSGCDCFIIFILFWSRSTQDCFESDHEPFLCLKAHNDAYVTVVIYEILK